MSRLLISFLFFFFNDTATTEIYTLSLHDALPISRREGLLDEDVLAGFERGARERVVRGDRSEEHTSELQSPCNLVCRLLLEKKKKKRLEAVPEHVRRRRAQEHRLVEYQHGYAQSV